jgi:hypothetical protein
MSELDPATMKGPGDFDPPDDKEGYKECEACGKEFSFDPKEYWDADEDGTYFSPPDLCTECQEKHDKDIPVTWDEWFDRLQEDEKLQEDVAFIILNTKKLEAEKINSSGPSNQLAYLREAMKPEELEAELIDCIETQDDGRFDRDEELEAEITAERNDDGDNNS